MQICEIKNSGVEGTSTDTVQFSCSKRNALQSNLFRFSLFASASMLLASFISPYDAHADPDQAKGTVKYETRFERDISVSKSGKYALLDQGKSNFSKDKYWKFYVFSSKVTDFIKDLVRDDNISIKMSSKVKGRLNKRKLNGTRENILDRLAREFEFDWFLHDRMLYISNQSESVKRHINLGGLPANDVEKVLENAGLDLQRFPIRHINGGKSLIVSGPPSYVALIETVIEKIQVPKEEEKPVIVDPSKKVILWRGVKRRVFEVPSASIEDE